VRHPCKRLTSSTVSRKDRFGLLGISDFGNSLSLQFRVAAMQGGSFHATLTT